MEKIIGKLLDRKNLTSCEANEVMGKIMSGNMSEVQISTFLTALRMKGESVEEIVAFAKVLREKGRELKTKTPVMDIVGTGGDGIGSFNISTTTAFVVSASGIPVAKHGNRNVSSKSGAADVLEKLGVKIDLLPEAAEKVLEKVGLSFMFAPIYHSSMKYVAPVRKEMKIRTVFNLLGPLANPAKASMQVMGVYDEKLLLPLAEVLRGLGVEKGMVIHGEGGLDEGSVSGETKVCEIRNGEIKSYKISPKEIGLDIYNIEDIIGGNPEENAKITKDILTGMEKGAKRDIVLLNSGIAIYLGNDNISLKEAVDIARETIDSKKALNKLNELIKITNEVADDIRYNSRVN